MTIFALKPTPTNIMIPEQQILKGMVADNPWWTTGHIFSDYDAMHPRMFLSPFMQLLRSMPCGRSIVMLGPRRVGKTVMMFHAVKELLTEGVPHRKILFFSVDNPLYSGMSLEQLLDAALKATKQEVSPDMEGYCIFFDEIQYLRDWERHLKVMCDRHRKARFVASGSAAAALRMKSMESGAGRFTHFSLPPLLFCEYLAMTGADSLVVPAMVEWFGERSRGFDCVDYGLLNEKFCDYINFGGYPEVVLSMQQRINPGRYIKEDIVDKVLLRDLPGLYGITDTRDLYRLYIHIVYRTGEEFTYEDLSKESGIRKETIRRYLEYLESAFLIKVLHKVDENARRFQRVTTFKIYVTNPSVFSAIFSPASPADAVFNHLVETAVYSQLAFMKSADSLYYANWKKGRRAGEVDFVRLGMLSQKPERALEVKWSDRYFSQVGELQSLLDFMVANSMGRSVVTTLSAAGSRQVGDITLQYVPTALYAYAAGYNALESAM